MRLFLALALAFGSAHGHPSDGHAAPTYRIASSAVPCADGPCLVLTVLDAATGGPTPARFSLAVDGQPYTPARLDTNGIHFTSIHRKKRQRQTVLYSRGRGPVHCPLPATGDTLTLSVSKGYEYLPVRQKLPLNGGDIRLTVALRRWSDLAADGWRSADAHLHFERPHPDLDGLWATMLAADDLDDAFFLVLAGGNLPGEWAKQYAYGPSGTYRRAGHRLIPGEEFRGKAQGHVTLLGMAAAIRPLAVGAMAPHLSPHHWPTTHQTLTVGQAAGGIGGTAHGGRLAKASTVYRDAMLGASQFVELANTHRYELEAWYDLLNSGFFLAPTAGTDLPNYPFRDNGQPFLGETRMYVQGNGTDWRAWREAVVASRVFITSGPLIRLAVNGQGLGHTHHLPAGGAPLHIEAQLASPLPLHRFELLRDGRPLDLTPQKRLDANGVHRWVLQTTIAGTTSCWLAARGWGSPKEGLQIHTGKPLRAMAHTAAVPVVVGQQPLGQPQAIDKVRAALQKQKNWYKKNGRYPDLGAALYVEQLFDRALDILGP